MTPKAEKIMAVLLLALLALPEVEP